jgi:hypothetical protein
MKHLKHATETCVYNQSSICNIQIYFYNIQIKHLQHKSENILNIAWNKHV